MGELINKVTLYDIISFTIPGSLTVFIMVIVNKCIFKKIYLIIDNDAITVIVFLLASYCIGWILSELMHFLYKKVILNKSIIEHIPDFNRCINIIFTLLLVSIFGYLYYTCGKEGPFSSFQKLLLLLCFGIAFIIEIKKIYEKNEKHKRDIEIRLLKCRCTEYLKVIYSNELDNGIKELLG